MADSAERQLKILLKLAADVGEKGKVTGALKEIETQAISTAKATGAAVNIGALSPAARADLVQTLATGKGIGVFANEAKLAAAGMAANFGIAGVNLSRAKTEAIVLMREIAAGGVRASTLSSLMGSMGNSIAIAGVAAYGLGQLIQRSADEGLRLNKELAKQTDQLSENVDKWIELAKVAGNFGDIVKLGLEIGPALNTAAVKLAEFRAQQVSGFGKFFDYVKLGFALAATGTGAGFTYETPQLDEAKKKALGNFRDQVVDAKIALDEAKRSADEFARIKLEPAGLQITDITDKLDKLRGQQGTLEGRVQVTPQSSESEIADAAKALDLLAKKNAEIQIWEKRLKEATDAQQKETDAEEKGDRRARMQEINALLRDQSTTLESIRQQQQLINADPFLSADAKQMLTLMSMTAELLKIRAAIEQTKVALSNSALDPVTHERLQAALQRDQFEFELLSLKIAKINKPLGSELADWVNSFGTAAHQIAGLIEGSINAALQATNQLIIDAAFRTGDWRQTVVGVEKQVIGLFLTMLEQMAIQQAASLLGITTTTSAQVASGAAITAAHAPAAAATSISSYGTAALVGEIAAIAAIIAIMAALGGGFKRGGYTGAGHEDQIAGPAHKGEFYFSKAETESIGLSNLYALKHSAPRFGVGGRVYEDAGYFGGRATLPSDPGEIEPPILFGTGNYVGHANPNPRTGPIVQVFRGAPGAGSVPYWNRPSPGSYNLTPNYPAQFGGNLGLATFSGWSNLGFGTRPAFGTGIGAAYGEVPVGRIEPNSALGTYQMWTGTDWQTIGRLGESIATIQNRAAAVASGSAGGEFAGGAGAAGFGHAAGYIGYGPSNQSIADLRLMADQARSGGGNNMGTTGDPGHTIFNLTGNRFVGKIVDGTLVHVLHPYGRAGGGRIPGPASRADNILSWLSTGERVVPADRNILLERKFGFDWDKRLELAMPRLASGGRIGGTTAVSSQKSAEPIIDVHVYSFDDRRKAQRAYEESPHARKVFRDRLNRYS